MSPPIGGRASAGSCETAPTSRLSSKNDRPPNVRAGSSRRHRSCAASVLAIQSDARIEPEQGHRARAVRPLGGDDAVADRGERATVDELAGQRRQRRRAGRQLAEEPGQVRRRDVGRDDRPERQHGVGEGGEGGRTDRPAGDDQPTATGQPAAHRGELEAARAGRPRCPARRCGRSTTRPRPARAGRPGSG